MGNSFACFSPTVKKISKKSSDQLPPWISNSDNQKSRKLASSSKKEEIIDDSYIKQQALVASMLYHHHLQSGDLLNLDRSISVKYPPPSSNKQKKLQKRSYSVSDSSSKALQFIHQDVGTEESESKHFVLVHGGGFGAWCWYKIIALLKDSKHEVEAIDLTGSGVNSCDINCITTLAEYAKPLTDFLAKLEDGKKVILVGHDFGGVCVSYAMELYPAKVSKAIFVAAAMLTSGQSVLDVFSQQSCLNDLNQRAWKFSYANGKNHPPTAIDLDKSLLEDLLFNRTSSKDIALASVSMRQVPFAPWAEKLSLSTANYGSIPKFYIKTEEDFAIPVPLQEAMIKSNQPKQVFQLKGSDHSPFFSKPQALHRLLVEVSKITFM
ncbi:putative methylesterase 13 [Forsythia ovata]|uniref:Methylesterase 13 n=1 Tax=Forsythia ovata TaxID=205694 RepID=A0ABD1WAL2_9LAMI